MSSVSDSDLMDEGVHLTLYAPDATLDFNLVFHVEGRLEARRPPAYWLGCEELLRVVDGWTLAVAN